MKKYIALHTYKTTPEQTWKLLGEVANDLALAMDEGKTPARCLKTWNPFPSRPERPGFLPMGSIETRGYHYHPRRIDGAYYR